MSALERPSPREIALRLIYGQIGGASAYRVAVADLQALDLTSDEVSVAFVELGSLFTILAVLDSDRTDIPVEDIPYLLEQIVDSGGPAAYE